MEVELDAVKSMSDAAGEQWLDEHMRRGERWIAGWRDPNSQRRLAEVLIQNANESAQSTWKRVHERMEN
jgi:hypothetical protein